MAKRKMAVENFDYERYFAKLLSVFNDDIAAIALQFFPRGNSLLWKNIAESIKSTTQAPWKHSTFLKHGQNVHQALWHIFQAFDKYHGVDEMLSDEMKLAGFNLALLFGFNSGLLTDDSVSELCAIWSGFDNSPTQIIGKQLYSQLTALLLKDPVLGLSILSEIIVFAEQKSARSSPVVKQICQIFFKAVQTATDDLPYIDTLSPQAQNERIFTLLYLLSNFNTFSKLHPLKPGEINDLIECLVSSSKSVRPFAALSKDCKLQFAAICGELRDSYESSPDELSELISKALLASAWFDFEDNTNPNYSKVTRLFSGLVKHGSALSESEQLFWLFLASYSERKTYIELFLMSCKECIDSNNMQLLEKFIHMKPFHHNKTLWFLMLASHCQTLAQTLQLRNICFPDQNSQASVPSTLPGFQNAPVLKLKSLLTFLQKIDLFNERASSLDDMSQEKLAEQLEKCLQTQLLLSSDLALIDYFLDISELHPDIVVSLIIDLANIRFQPSGSKSVRFKIPAGASPSDSEPLTDYHILAQIFSYYAYCALRNMTDSVYGCSVHISPFLKDRNASIQKAEIINDSCSETYSLTFSADISAKYHTNCTSLLDYGRTYCRLIYPLGLRLEVIENAFSLLFISYDHVHERIQDIAAEEAEGDLDFEDKALAAKYGFKSGSSMASSSVLTQSTQVPTGSSEPSNQKVKGFYDQLVGCLANEFLFRDMLFTLNECTKDLINDVHSLDTEGVSFRISSGHLIALKMTDDVGLSDHMSRDSLKLPGFKDRLYRIQRAISEALWRLSIVSGVIPVYGSLELKLSLHDYYKREFKNAFSNELERHRHTNSLSGRGSIGRRTTTGSESTLKGVAVRTTALRTSDSLHLLRNGFVEKLACSNYMLALCWSANHRDIERCEQIIGSYPLKFGADSEFAADVKFQRGLNAFIADVLLQGPVLGQGGRRLRLAIPFESPSKQKTYLNRSTSSQVASPGVPASPTSSESRMSTLNLLVATSLTQIEIKEKIEKLFDGGVFSGYVDFFQTHMTDFLNHSLFGRPALLESTLSRDSIAALTAVDLAFCFSPNLETAAALLSNLPAPGLAPMQTLIASYLKYAGLPAENSMSDIIFNSLKWFTSTKLIQPDWTPSGVLVSPLFNVNPDLVARTRSGIMSLSRLITMTIDSLEAADHDKAEAMLTQVVTLLSADWVETAGRTIFLRSTANKELAKDKRLCYLSTFWNRLKEMYRSLGELGLQRQQQEIRGPLDLLAFSPESIFSQIIFSVSTPAPVSLNSKFKLEEIAKRLNVDLLQTIAVCSCAQLSPDAHELSVELVDEVFALAINELLEPNEDPVGQQMRAIFLACKQLQHPPPTSIAARLWVSCSDTTSAGLNTFPQAKPPTQKLNCQTVKLVYDRSERLFVLISFLSDFAHILQTDSADDKAQPEVALVKTQLRSLKARITENFRPLLTYMSIATIPLLSAINPAFPSSLDAILLLPAQVKATLLVSDLSTWFTSTVLRSLMCKPEDGSSVNSLALFDILPDPINAIPTVIEYRDMAIIYAVESFFNPDSLNGSGDFDLSRIMQLIARISDPCKRLAIMRRHCNQFTLSGFDFLVLTCPIPKSIRADSFDGAFDPGSNGEAGATNTTEITEGNDWAKELTEWIQDWQKRVDLWMRLAALMRLDTTTTTVEHIHNLISNQSDYVAECLISAGDFSTGLQLLNVCGASAFPVSLATKLMSAYLTSQIEESMESPEQQARVVQQLDILGSSDPESCKQLLVSFLSNLVLTSSSAASIVNLPSRVCTLLEFCKSVKIRRMLEKGSPEDSLLVDRLDQMVAISRLLPSEDMKEACGPLIHKPLLLIETLLMNVKVELAALVVKCVMKAPMITPEQESAIQNLVAVYSFKAIELPSSSNNDAQSVTSIPSNVASSSTPLRKTVQIVGSNPVASSPAAHSMTRPFLMPAEAPDPERWMHDAKTETCMACHRVRFTMFNRRHHCRRCGRIVCDDCSRKRATVRGENDARVCEDCFAQMVVIGEHSGVSGTTPGNTASYSAAQQRGLPSSACSASITSGGTVFQWQLSPDDETANSHLRQQFSFESAPNLALCLSVLSLCQNSSKSAQMMLQIVSYLSRYLKPTREIDSALVLSIMKQLLMRAKVKFTETTTDLSAMSGLATMCDSYSKAIDFLDSLLQDNCQPIPTVSELIGRESSQRILTQLLSAERYAAAVRLASLMRPDLAGNAWLRWGLALLRVGCYESARQKFVKCLPKSADRKSVRPVSKQLQEILTTLENVAKRHPNIVADLVSSDSNDRTVSMTIRDLLAEPQQLTGKALMTDPLPKPIFDEAVFYLTTYGNDGAVVSFFQRHGYWAQAARYILEADCMVEVFVNSLLIPAASAGRLLNLEDQMLVCDATLVRWEKYIAAAYQQLSKTNSQNLLHRLYVFAKDYIRAAYVCLRQFFPRGANTWMDLAQNIDFLHQARGHLEAYIDRSSSHWGQVEPPTPKRPTWDDVPVVIRQFLPQAEVQRLSNAISLQFEIIEVMKARARSNPNGQFVSSESSGGVKTLFTDVDSDKMSIVTELLTSASLVDSFTLARRIVTDFRLDPRVTYGNLGHELARSGNFERLRHLLICLRDVFSSGQSESSELIDDIICAAVRGIHDRSEFSREQDALIAMLSDDDAKIEACLLCGKLRSAYLIAIHSNRERDVRRISDAATRLNQPLVKQICDNWLEQFNKEKSLSS